jgi:hypothetical protein
MHRQSVLSLRCAVLLRTLKEIYVHYIYGKYIEHNTCIPFSPELLSEIFFVNYLTNPMERNLFFSQKLIVVQLFKEFPGFYET